MLEKKKIIFVQNIDNFQNLSIIYNLFVLGCGWKDMLTWICIFHLKQYLYYSILLQATFTMVHATNIPLSQPWRVNLRKLSYPVTGHTSNKMYFPWANRITHVHYLPRQQDITEISRYKCYKHPEIWKYHWLKSETRTVKVEYSAIVTVN